jgi:hypothetical protein
MKSKILNIILILLLIAIFGGLLSAQETWVVKISDLAQVDITVYESDIITKLENGILFQSFFPNPQMQRQPLTDEIFSFREKIKEQMENEDMKKNMVEQYIASLLFEIRADALGLYSKSKLKEKSDRFYKLMEFEVTKVLYMIKGLLPKANPTQEEIDKWFDNLKSQAEKYGQQIPLDKLEELALKYAKDAKVQKMLMDAINRKTGEKIIIYDDNDPFLVKIDGVQVFTQQEAEEIFKAFVDYTAYIVQGGVVEDAEIEKQYTKKELKKTVCNYSG